MKIHKLSFAVAMAFAAAPGAQAQVSNDTVKIGFITDISGPYSDTDGTGGVEAVKMAIEDFGGKVNGKKIEFISADHQNKADIAASKAREWIDTQGISLVFGGTNSATALSMAKVAQEVRAPTAELTSGLPPEILLEKYRQQVSHLQMLALGPDAVLLDSLVDDADKTTAAERAIWKTLRKGQPAS